MIHLTSAAYFILAIGVLTSVSLIGLHQILLAAPAIYLSVKGFKEKHITFSWSTLFLLLFTIWSFGSLVFNYPELSNPSKSFGKLKFLLFGLAGIPVLYYWIPRLKPSHFKILFNFFLLSIITAGSVAICQAITSGGARSEGFIGIMRYGYASAMILSLVAGILLQRKKLPFDINVKLLFVAVCFGITGLILTKTRGALAGFVCALPFILYYYRVRLGLVVGALSALFIGLLAFAYLFGSGDYGTRLLKSRNDLGDVVRQEQWRSAIIATFEHPLFGWGVNNFHSQVERIKKENNLKTTFYINQHSHNTFLEIAAGTGIVGLVLFLLWLIFWAFECLKLENAFRGIFIPFGVSFVVSSQFEVVLDTNNAALIFFVYSLSQFVIIQNIRPYQLKLNDSYN